MRSSIHIKTHLKYFLWVILICGASTGLSILLNKQGIGKENTLMIFLVGVLIITVLTKGYLYGFITSFFNFLMFNYFFTEPYHSFIISEVQDLILISFFLLASLICGTMSSKFQQQTEKAKHNEKISQLLYNISESFLNVTGLPSIAKNGIKYISEYTGYPCCVTLNQSKFALKETSFYSSDFRAEEYDQNELYPLPITDLSNEMGTIFLANVSQPISYDHDMLIKAVIYQMALVLDREFIYYERERIRLAMESEHLKSTLLRSVSHDIRTPLTGIIGASSLILDSYESFDDEAIKKLASDINEEATWLNHSVQNILDMTRISEGKLIVKKEYEAVDDLINQAIIHVPWLTGTNRLHVTVPDDILLVETDGKLMVQVLINLLDNAYKHSGKDTVIELHAFREKDTVVFEVSDNGFGIDKAIENTLFEGFITQSCNTVDGNRGVGLGLTICKSIVEAHSGKISASNKPEGGALFRIELPYKGD